MLDSLDLVLRDECGLDKSSLLLVGVSGGPDSLCLLDVLHRLGYPLHVAHVNHLLRSQSVSELQLVQQAAVQRGLPFSSTEVDVLAYADQETLTVEEAARSLRYRFLFTIAQQTGAQAVVVGHNADDQVETVLLHLLRGSGLAGLRGMSVRALPNTWSTALPLLRPLLRTWRTEIDAYCVENGLQPAQDLSNLDPTYTRNRLRLELIPLLESCQPGVRGRLVNLAQLVSAEDDFLSDLLEASWQSCLLQQGERFIELHLERLRDQPLALQRRLLRRAVDLLRPGLMDITFDHIERALQFVRQPPKTRQTDWMAGLRLIVEGESLWLAGWEADLPLSGGPQLSHGQVLWLRAPGMTALSGSWLLRAELVELDTDGWQRALLNSDPYQAWLDAGRLELPLLLRGRQTGDLFEPLGMNGQRVKLKDWMINQKLPQRARAGWPLVCSGAEIVWIPGFQLAHFARITPDTRQILHLSLAYEAP